MQGHLRKNGSACPRHRRGHDESGSCGHDDRPQARLFLCADQNCRAQALICSACDRGHIYCADCAPHARRRSLHAAGRRYQASRRGQIRHAERSRRYRARKYRTAQNNVTHHGSPADRWGALLSTDPAVVEEQSPTDNRSPPRRQEWRCLSCGRRCSEHVRQGFLPRRVPRNRRRGPDRDYPR